MKIEGLDYNTQRSRMRMPEYGREVQTMVEHAMALPTKEERQQCAQTIIKTMKLLAPATNKDSDRIQTLWNHLAIISEGKLDIDYPVDITGLDDEANRPERVPYPDGKIPVRHYGKAMFQAFEKLKTMEPGRERDMLMGMVANQMKRCLMLYGLGNANNEKVADDLARYTDGVIQLDLQKFRFETVDVRAIQAQLETPKKKKKKKK